MLIFLSGIHGVGKSYFINHLINKNNMLKNTVTTISASQLIRDAKKSSYASSPENQKIVSNLDNNQELLIEGVKSLDPNKIYIIDGHTCLLDKNMSVIKIDLSTFMKLKLDSIILLTPTDTTEIRRRYRDRNHQHLAEWDHLEDFTAIEKSHSQFIAKELNIPFYEIKNDDIFEFTNRIQSIIKNS